MGQNGPFRPGRLTFLVVHSVHSLRSVAVGPPKQNRSPATRVVAVPREVAVTGDAGRLNDSVCFCTVYGGSASNLAGKTSLPQVAKKQGAPVSMNGVFIGSYRTDFQNWSDRTPRSRGAPVPTKVGPLLTFGLSALTLRRATWVVVRLSSG